jgi:hypothetical protein
MAGDSTGQDDAEPAILRHLALVSCDFIRGAFRGTQ